MTHSAKLSSATGAFAGARFEPGRDGAASGGRPFGTGASLPSRRRLARDDLSRLRRCRAADRRRAGRARRRARRPCRDPRRHAPGVDAGRLRRAVRPARCVVPVYHTNSPEECAYVLAHSGARVVFCEDARAAGEDRADPRARCPTLEHVVVLTGAADGALTLGELRQRGAGVDADALDARPRPCGPSDAATIVYTSGTTGPPKGCVLTHANLLARSRCTGTRSGWAAAVVDLHVPPARARACACGADGRARRRRDDRLLARRRQRGCSTTSPRRRPTHFPSVPRVLEKVHTRVLGDVARRRPRARRSSTGRCADGRDGRAPARAGRHRRRARCARRHALADRLVLSKVRDAVRRAICGWRSPARRRSAARCSSSSTPAACSVLEGYGLTETCAASTLNTADASRARDRRAAAARAPRCAIADDGEVLMRGAARVRRLPPRRAATAEALDGRLAAHRRPRLASTTTATCASPGARRTSSSPRAART